LYEKLNFYQNAKGGILSPDISYEVARSLKTLGVRMNKHCENAMKIAKLLENNNKVKKVIYPGLESHPQHKLADRQMHGYGGMLSFELNGNYEDTKKFLQSLELFLLAESLGGVESLVEHPASMTHAYIPKKERKKLGISDSFVRFSVGIEDVEDLILDINSGLKNID